MDIKNKNEDEEALQAELKYRQQPIKLNQQILKNICKETDLKPDKYVDFVNFWQKLQEHYTCNNSYFLTLKRNKIYLLALILILILALIILFQIISINESLNKKDDVSVIKGNTVPLELLSDNPKKTADELKEELAECGYSAIISNDDDIYIVEVESLIGGNSLALFEVLYKYDLILPPSDPKFKINIRKK
jgi:hypothetical protein